MHKYSGWAYHQQVKRNKKWKATVVLVAQAVGIVVISYLAVVSLGALVAAFTPGGGHGF